MAHLPTSSDLTGPCEKFFGAITGTTALKAMRRVSLRPQSPKPNIPTAGTLTKYDPSSVVLISIQPQSPKPELSPASSLLIPISSGAGKAHLGNGIGEAAESVPIMFVPADEKKKPKVEMAGQEKNFPVPIIASEMTPELQGASQRELGVAGQAFRPLSKPNTGPAPAYVSALDMAQPERLTPGPGSPQIGKVVQKIRLEIQMPAPNKEIGQSHVQGARPPPKVEAAPPSVSLQEKPKPVIEQGQKEEGSKTGHHNIDHRCSAYIDRTKNKIRATSDVGKSYPGADSSNTKMKAKTSSNVGGGKSASFKK